MFFSKAKREQKKKKAFYDQYSQSGLAGALNCPLVARNSLVDFIAKQSIADEMLESLESTIQLLEMSEIADKMVEGDFISIFTAAWNLTKSRFGFVQRWIYSYRASLEFESALATIVDIASFTSPASPYCH